MRVLVVTQVVDKDDRALGFFHRWLEEMAHSFTRLEVICLREGQHALPGNVPVHSLGKESGPSRAKYVWRFYSHIWRLRHHYDAVFVHMNQEYVILGALFWKFTGKRVILWRNHKMGSRLTDVACRLADVVCYTSPQAYVAALPHAVRMPIGVDTTRFRQHAEPAPHGSVLFLGRMDPVKKPEVFLAAIDLLARKGITCVADCYGDPTDPKAPHVSALKALVPPLEERGMLRWRAGVSHEETPAIYAAHSIYVNITPSGSFDKTIGEAMASGCVVVAANTAIRGIIPDDLLVDANSSQDVARGIEAALMLHETEREEVVRASVAFIEREHSLKALVGSLAKLLR